jgi:MFS family permease
MNTITTSASIGADKGSSRPMTRDERKAILASFSGTLFEWYDFFLYLTLTSVIAKQFFSGLSVTSSYVFTLLGLAVGFLVRPLGAIVFGRLGDTLGRKRAFLITVLIMGIATFIVGLLPNYAHIGFAAPVLLIVCRMLQGFALGGEYGGAITYVAEHSPMGKRGSYTAWIQTAATLGLFMALITIVVTRRLTGEGFDLWGWRIPFLLSMLLLGVSVWVRLGMVESPAFKALKLAGKTAKWPVIETFSKGKNLRLVVLALLGLTAGQAVVWYTGQFYTLAFLIKVAKVDLDTASLLVAASLLLGAPFFIVFGRWSDRIGRKPIIMAGCLIAALSYFWVFPLLLTFANPDLAAAQIATPVIVKADLAQCSFQGSPIARDIDFVSSCDVAKRTLTEASIPYVTESVAVGKEAEVKIGDKEILAPKMRLNPQGDTFLSDSKAALTDFKKVVLAQASAKNLIKPADKTKINDFAVVSLLTFLVVLVTMVYGPIAAILVEMFPTRIRYTAVSVPYHVGNGWFGGLLPSITFGWVAATGDVFSGLWYPVIIAAMTFVIGMLFIKDTKDVDIFQDD